MSVTIQIDENIQATVEDFRWTSNDPFYEAYLNGALEDESAGSSSPSMGDADHWAADRALKLLGRGKIVQAHKPASVPEDRVM